MIIASMRFIHCPICFSDFKGIRFLYSDFLKNSNIIIFIFRHVDSKVLQS